MGSNSTDSFYNLDVKKPKFFLDSSDQLEIQPQEDELAPSGSNHQASFGEENVFSDYQMAPKSGAKTGESVRNEFDYLNMPLESLLWEVLAPYLHELKPGKSGSGNSRIYNRIAEDFDHKFPGRCRDVRRCISREFYNMRLRAQSAAAAGHMKGMYKQINEWYLQATAQASVTASNSSWKPCSFNSDVIGYKRRLRKRKRSPPKQLSSHNSPEIVEQHFSGLTGNFSTLRRPEGQIIDRELSAEREPLASFGESLTHRNRQQVEDEVREEVFESETVENPVQTEDHGSTEPRETVHAPPPTQQVHPEVGVVEERPQNRPKISDVLRTIHFCRSHGFGFEMANGCIVLKDGTQTYHIPFGQMEWDG